MPLFSDSDLAPATLALARAGEVKACEAVFRAFEVPVRTLTRRLVPGRAAAEDLAQDVFVEVFAKLGQFDGRGSLAGWVRVITVTRCLMYLRSPWHRGLRWLEGDAEAADRAGGEAVGEGDALDLEHALARLGATARAVVWLHDVEGYTHAEIGALYGASASFSKSQLARAHERLRELLEPREVEAPCTPVSSSC